MSAPLLVTFLVTPLGGDLSAAPSQPCPPSPPSAFEWGDANGDGLPDAVVLLPGLAPRLLQNRPAGGFQDVTREAGLAGLPPATRALWSDLDGDGDQDLLLLGPGEASALWRNDAGRSFARTGAETGLDLVGGLLFAEEVHLDGDGRPDLHVSGPAADALYRNLGGLRFEPVALDLPARAESRPAPGWQAAVAPGASSLTPSGTTPGGALTSAAAALCPSWITDQATGACVPASTVPTLGALLPLGPELNVDASGRVGVGTLSPAFRLDVEGDVHASGQLVSSATSGAPLVVSSSALVAGLNADRLDGLDATAFSQLGDQIEIAELAPNAVDGARILDGSVAAADLASNAVTSAKIAAGAVDTTDLADGAVQASKIAKEAVKSDLIALGAVTDKHIAVKSILESHLTLDAVTSGAIAKGAVGSDEIADGSVAAADLAPGAVTAGIGTGSITSAHVANGTLTDADVSASANLQGTKILPDFGPKHVVTTGHVGIGTTVPKDDLHLRGDGPLSIRLEADVDATGGTDQPSLTFSQDNGLHQARLGFFGGSDDFDILHASPNDLHLGTAGLRRVTINGSGGWLGVNTTDPLGTIHAVGDPVEGRILIAPNVASSGADSEVFFAEDDDGTFGMAWRYDGGLNQMHLYGSTGGAADPFLRVSRDDGNVVVEKDLHVAGAATGNGGIAFAYGTVGPAGTKLGGSSNWTVAWNSSLGEYQITLSGISDFDFDRYSVVVTPTDGGTTVVVPQLNDGGTNRWDVKFWTLVVTAVPTEFCFVVYRY